MPTTIAFAAQFGAAAGGGNIFDGNTPTITADIDDGAVSVGDLVNLSGFNVNVLNLAGIVGNDAFYLGSTTFNGFPMFIFGEANSVGGNTAFLGLSTDSGAISPATSGLFAQWADSPAALSADNACFASGTLIATPEGEKTVETLAIGDMVTTAKGAAVCVKWIGRQTIGTTLGFYGREPVCIQAGALGNGLPRQDLTVTGDHGMIVDGLVINASALVNGTTIDFVPASQLGPEFTVYHIETEAHDVILANGAATETFIDIASRAKFDNYGEYLALYGVQRIIPEMSRHRIATQRLLPDVIRTRLGIGNAQVEILKSA